MMSVFLLSQLSALASYYCITYISLIFALKKFIHMRLTFSIHVTPSLPCSGCIVFNSLCLSLEVSLQWFIFRFCFQDVFAVFLFVDGDSTVHSYFNLPFPVFFLYIILVLGFNTIIVIGYVNVFSFIFRYILAKRISSVTWDLSI